MPSKHTVKQSRKSLDGKWNSADKISFSTQMQSVFWLLVFFFSAPIPVKILTSDGRLPAL
jgi:hypothetical protein